MPVGPPPATCPSAPQNLFDISGADWKTLDGGEFIALASIALSLGLWRFARNTDRDPQFILDVGLGYMVAICMGLGLLIHWTPVPEHWPVVPMISWIGPIMLIFAALLPTTPPKTVLAGLLSASMNPLGMILGKASGHFDYPSLVTPFLMHYPDYLLIPVAVVISRVVTGLGLQVAKAREMGSYGLGERIGRGIKLKQKTLNSDPFNSFSPCRAFPASRRG